MLRDEFRSIKSITGWGKKYIESTARVSHTEIEGASGSHSDNPKKRVSRRLNRNLTDGETIFSDSLSDDNALRDRRMIMNVRDNEDEMMP